MAFEADDREIRTRFALKSSRAAIDPASVPSDFCQAGLGVSSVALYL
jgi:hypothetical protein